MKFNYWKSVAEVIGGAAIVGSLIFVGLQIEQEQDIALSEINLSLLASQIDLNNSIGDHADIWVRGSAGEALEEPERIIFDGLLKNMAYLARTDWRQYGRFDQTRFVQVAIADFALHLYQNPGARQSWTTRGDADEKNRALLISGFQSSFRIAVLADLRKLDQIQQ